MAAQFEPVNYQQPTQQPRQTRRKSTRSWFWPGFVIGLLLTSAISCGGLAWAMGLGDLRLSDLQSGEPAWIPPNIIQTPDVVQANSDTGAEIPEQLEGVFQIGTQVRNATNSRVNIRRTPGHLGKPGDDILGQAQPGEQMLITAGPTGVDDSLVWWRIRYTRADGGVIEGWVAEATSSGVKILGHAE